MEFIHTLDHLVLEFANNFARRSKRFDRIIGLPSRIDLLKTAVLVLPLWLAWFKDSADRDANRRLVAKAVIAAFLALVIGRILQNFLPYRHRPLHDPDVNFVVPFGGTETALQGWSSFPSDHAVFVFALAMALFFISRRIGLFALLWAAVVVCVPRVYFGLHYPTDIIGGALIGIGVALFVHNSRLAHRVTTVPLAVERRWPEFFYPVAFLVTWQMLVLFDDVRLIISTIT